MCRSIKTLRRRDQTATDEEVRAAALQFVRKDQRLQGAVSRERGRFPRGRGRDRLRLQQASRLPEARRAGQGLTVEAEVSGEPGGLDAQAYFRRGNEFSNLGEYQLAIQDFTQSISLDESSSMAYNNRGTAHLCIGDFESAVRDLCDAIRLDPEYREAYHNRGLAYSELGRVDDAVADLTRAIELDPGFWSAYRHRGILYWLKGDERASFEDYKRARELSPS